MFCTFSMSFMSFLSFLGLLSLSLSFLIPFRIYLEPLSVCTHIGFGQHTENISVRLNKSDCDNCFTLLYVKCIVIEWNIQLIALCCYFLVGISLTGYHFPSAICLRLYSCHSFSFLLVPKIQTPKKKKKTEKWKQIECCK